MQTWRQEQRLRLIAERQSLSEQERSDIQAECLMHLLSHLHAGQPGTLGLYWPIKGELDCRSLAATLIDSDWLLSIPIINPDTQRLDFALWQPDTVMQTGTWNIPIPAEPILVEPERFVVPLVGFDSNNFRLGYGGGYYDRTLAAVSKPVETIGLGLEMGRFESIHPHELDIPMTYIVTEKGIQ